MAGLWSLAGASDQARLARSSPAQKKKNIKIKFSLKLFQKKIFFKKICDFLIFFTAL